MDARLEEVRDELYGRDPTHVQLSKVQAALARAQTNLEKKKAEQSRIALEVERSERHIQQLIDKQAELTDMLFWNQPNQWYPHDPHGSHDGAAWTEDMEDAVDWYTSPNWKPHSGSAWNYHDFGSSHYGSSHHCNDRDQQWPQSQAQERPAPEISMATPPPHQQQSADSEVAASVTAISVQLTSMMAMISGLERRNLDFQTAVAQKFAGAPVDIPIPAPPTPGTARPIVEVASTGAPRLSPVQAIPSLQSTPIRTPPALRDLQFAAEGLTSRSPRPSRPHRRVGFKASPSNLTRPSAERGAARGRCRSQPARADPEPATATRHMPY